MWVILRQHVSDDYPTVVNGDVYTLHEAARSEAADYAAVAARAGFEFRYAVAELGEVEEIVPPRAVDTVAVTDGLP